MNIEQIVDIIIDNAREVLPKLEGRDLQGTDSLRDLGANSIDRSEIVMMTLEALSIRVPLVEFAAARNIGELAGILHERL